MQLEQQESFEIKGPQLEVFGEAETRLPAAAKKRPAALAVLAVAIVASVLGILGDLFASAVKRQVGIKDYGTIFPGHGGVLDRFDSVIFCAPLIELLLRFLPAVGGA